MVADVDLHLDEATDLTAVGIDTVLAASLLLLYEPDLSGVVRRNTGSIVIESDLAVGLSYVLIGLVVLSRVNGGQHHRGSTLVREGMGRLSPVGLEHSVADLTLNALVALGEHATREGVGASCGNRLKNLVVEVMYVNGNLLAALIKNSGQAELSLLAANGALLPLPALLEIVGVAVTCLLCR